MGVSLNGKGWGCWRNQAHRGRDPKRLIMALIGCSAAEAATIAGQNAAKLAYGGAGLLETVRGALGAAKVSPKPAPLIMPQQLRQFNNRSLFWDYMLGRGYDKKEITELVHNFDLRGTLLGDWSYRVVIPVHDYGGDLVSWTGRAISDQAKLRYKTLTANPETAGDGPCAVGPITDFFLNMELIRRGGTNLILVEGPFDCFSLELYAGDYDSHATCFFGKAVSPAQMDLLVELMPVYDAIWLVLDPEAALDALAVRTQLVSLGVKTYQLEGNEDPGEMKVVAVRRMLEGLYHKTRKGNGF